ncbi:hypothetical protein E2C01_077444 [Portunus trituberculatus]|uniref:Uncharacterized protein n=1 Tax=Portunus trituberculatus TaxID=210409 RepID=A0A5B7IG34_PORTR|nr:hypothetical protein [Portunus trituberculatus]
MDIPQVTYYNPAFLFLYLPHDSHNYINTIARTLRCFLFYLSSSYDSYNNGHLKRFLASSSPASTTPPTHPPSRYAWSVTQIKCIIIFAT